MIKKKLKEQEEPETGGSNKTFDNKENSTTPENTNPEGQTETVQEIKEEPAGDASKGETAAADKVVADLSAVEEKLSEMQDKYIRLSAEFDNYRKRTLREKMELSKYAAEDLFLKILPLMDDFDRALTHMETATDCAAMKNGIDLIYNKFSEFLKQNGIKEIESLDSNFNVDLHEAVAKLPVGEEGKKGKVVDVVLKGYYIRDKVLRHSRVVVGE